MKDYVSGAVIRGSRVDADLVEFGGRGLGISFLSPDPHRLIGALPLGDPAKMSDLHRLGFSDILDYLEELGSHLTLETNRYMQEALEASCITAGQTPPLLRSAYRNMPQLFRREFVTELAETCIGIPYLEGWVTSTLLDEREIAIRAFGARTLHIIAGNSPFVAGLTVLRNAITRSDAIIKSPSNDPFTALGIAKTMIDMAPDHPITRHLSVAYWKGGDEHFEKQLYQPYNIEKICAWGGLASVKHVTKYIQPGLELISLDPKRSMSIIGPQALESDAAQREVAKRLATDIGALNQEGCINARVVYVLSGTDEAGVSALNRFGRHVYEALLALPEDVSTKPKEFRPDLRSAIRTASLQDEWYTVIGGADDEGAIIVSQTPERVEFAAMLASRVANLVPVDDISDVLGAVDAYTQTVGIYPESLKLGLRDILPLYGAQRLTTLGYAAQVAQAVPQDAIEPLRRMCRWIYEESCDPARVLPLWSGGEPFLPPKREPRPCR